jgi:hypothetical protein
MAKGVKTGGRQAGTPNKATKEFRHTVASLLAANAENVAVWLAQVANGHGDTKPDPAKALDLVAKLAEYSAPKLGRVEHAGDQENPLQTVARIELVAMSASRQD